MSVIEKNSEILFIYDAKMSNPNGDMDNENKPRMDYDTNTNLVSDVRLKRYIRDYYEKDLNREIFITENAKDSKDRAKQLKQNNIPHTDLIDVRLFGAVLADSGANLHFTGPLQFNWGYSLNPVEINESSTITSSFSSGTGVGKDFRVKYSVIAFSGGINANTAKDVSLTEQDVSEFDEVIIKSIPANRTRSKTGQTPRFYLRIESVDNKSFFKDMREYLKMNYNTEDYKIRTVQDFSIDISELTLYLKNNITQINKIFFWKDDMINIIGWEEFASQFNDKLQKI